MASFSIASGFKLTFNGIIPPAYAEMVTGQDLVIKFLSAENLPKMDLTGSTDPYFIAKLDDGITYTSTILSNTLSPKWSDEEWIVRNVSLNAKLTVSVYDKDDNKIGDDHVGDFEIGDLPNYQPPSAGHVILGSYGRHRGQFHLTIQSTNSSDENKKLPRYTFDGPCRYFRHNSYSVGRLTMLNTDYVYSTWEIQLRRISVYFHPYDRQYWNKHYRIALTIFGSSIRSKAKQKSFKLAHKFLYRKTIKNSETGRLTNADDLWKLIFFDNKTQRIRPRLYTYVIDDDAWRFSETGEAYFTDYASKHALHANCSEYVRYAGQFHPRPKFGWDRCDDEWELVFDNKSGTYAPSLDLLNNLKELLEFNFPGLNVVVYDHNDPLLKESMDKLSSAEKHVKDSSLFFRPMVTNLSATKTE